MCRHSSIRSVWFMALGLALAGAAAAADATYRDPRQPSFTLLVPDGWQAERNPQGVIVKRDGCYLMLTVRGGAAAPGSVLVQIRPQIESQWKSMRELDAGRGTFGGLDSAHTVVRGVPPSGIESVLRIVAATNGQLTFVAFAEANADLHAQCAPDLGRIERSFAPDPAR